MKKIILILLAAILVMPLAEAQRGKHRKGPKNPAVEKELKAHFQNEVMPAMNEALQEFDAKLSKEDLAFIQNKRKEIQTIKKAYMAKRKEMKSSRDSNQSREEMKGAWKEDRKKGKEEMHAFHESMKPFMERNKDLITTSLEELKPEHESWRATKKSIFEKYKPADRPSKAKEGSCCSPEEQKNCNPENCTPEQMKKCEEEKGKKAEKMEGRRGRKHHKKGRRGGKHGMRDGKPGKRGNPALRFVLWDGKAMANEAITRDTENAEELLPDLNQNYPNPASSLTTIEFELPADTKAVTLSITNNNGKEVKYLELGSLNAGEHQQEVQIGDLPNGNYFYTVNADGVKMTKKMVVLNR